MGDLLIQKTVPAKECERFANALTGRECRCDPSKLYTISVRAQGVTEQQQGEPVALPERKGTHLHYDTLMPTFSKGWNACLDEIAKLGPLYTHADLGEVERLTEQLEVANQAITYAAQQDKETQKTIDALMADAKQFRGERDTLRAQLDNALNKRLAAEHSLLDAKEQLAERDALLRKALASCDEATTAFEDDPNGPGGWTCHACFAECKAVWMHGQIVAGGPNQIEHTKDCWAEQARATLSASAEPSAPVERDERADFEALHDKTWPRSEFLHLSHHEYGKKLRWEGWQARAALERKP